MLDFPGRGGGPGTGKEGSVRESDGGDLKLVRLVPIGQGRSRQEAKGYERHEAMSATAENTWSGVTARMQA
jgi:hypothetical protein